MRRIAHYPQDTLPRLTRLRIIAPVVAAILTAGCFPATYIQRPAIRGRVVDEDSSQPIAGASVQMVRVKDDKICAEVTTGKDGKFFCPEDSKWFIFIVPMDFKPFQQYVVKASAEGRAAPTTQVSGGVRMLGGGVPRSGWELGDLRVP